MSKSGLCGKGNCVTRIGTTGTRARVIIPETIDTGEFNSTSIESLLQQYREGIIFNPGDNDPITKIIAEYGSDPFYLSVSALNTYFLRGDVIDLVNDGGSIQPTTTGTISNDTTATNTTTAVTAQSRPTIVSESYPLLAQRLNSGIPFTPIEVAEFTIGYGYTPTSLTVGTTVTSNKLIEELEAFYTGSFTSSTMGGFCALMPNIFGAIDTFFNAINDVKNLINKFKNFSLDFSLKALVDNLKNQIKKVIDKTVNKLKNIIENFSLDNVIPKIKSIINEKIGAQFQQIKETALKFFDEINIENFKKTIDGFIDYATNIFKEPKIEEIQFLIYRFCSFIASIEEGMNALKNPLDDFVNSYNETVNSLQAASSLNTAYAVAAGAIRYPANVRQQNAQTGYNNSTLAGNPPPISAEEFKDITPWNDGKGDSRVRFQGRWVSVLGREGWENVDSRVRARLMKIQKDFGRQIIINSGYRPEWYNSSVGGSKTSNHIQGLALDCTWNGFNSTSMQEFINLAIYYGFTEIIEYSTFVHIAGGLQSAAARPAPSRSFGNFTADGTVSGPGQAARPGSGSTQLSTAQQIDLSSGGTGGASGGILT